MNENWTWGPATVLVVAITLLAAIVGGVVVIVHPETLSFGEYLGDLKTFALAVSVIGIAHALPLAAQVHKP